MKVGILLFDNRKLKESWRYLNLQIIPVLPSNIIDSFCCKLMYKENYYNIYSGVTIFSNTLKSYEFLYQRTFVKDMPQKLNDLFKKVSSFYKNKTVQKLLQYSNNNDIPFYDLYKMDYFIRGDLFEQARDLILCFYEIDAYLSLATAIKDNKFFFPEFIDCKDPIFNAVNLKHPFLKDPKKYSVTFNRSNSLVFLTGPNMAGKTTFLKSCGIAVYLAHLGLAVPADSLEISFFTCLKSCINTEDDISLGYSYFYSEVLRVKDIAESVSNENNSFIIADEMFKGTNIHDAYDATEKILEGFSNFTNHLFLISSHIVEIAESQAIKNYLDCKCFDVEFNDEEIVYNYVLKNGISKTRLGMNILKSENIFKMLKLEQ